MLPQLTVLTDPVPTGRHFFVEPAKSVGRKVKRHFSPLPSYVAQQKYRGHFAVTRSLVEGLTKIGVPSNYNPKRLSQVAEIVVIPGGGLPTLAQAIEWKRNGRIKRLLAGPNIVIFPSDHKDLIAAPEIDLYLTPDVFTRDLYIEDCPALQGRCVPWPAGVDTEYWKPTLESIARDQVVVYSKQAKGPTASVSDCIEILQQRGYHVELIEYHKYTHSQYYDVLRRAYLMIGFVRSESQGLAWAEAWSMDVPTLIWRNDSYALRGKTWRASTAPYLTDETGLFFTDWQEFENALDQWEQYPERFHPRAWILENMSDEVCARKLCHLARVSAPDKR